MSGIDEVLTQARSGLQRLEPRDAAEALSAGALLVDTRPVEQRRRDGVIPGALIVDRNVLEWRLDPTCPHRIPGITDGDRLVILICNQGYSSSLAAATLQQVGLQRATDVIGGFEAWAADGLPVLPWSPTAETY